MVILYSFLCFSASVEVSKEFVISLVETRYLATMARTRSESKVFVSDSLLQVFYVKMLYVRLAKAHH